MSVEDPYAPPTAPVHEAETGTYHIADGKLHASSPLVLPSHLCVKCGANEASTKTYDKNLVYTPPWVIFGFLVIGILIVPVWLIVQKKLSIVYALCQGCASRRKNRLFMSLGVGIAGLVGLILGIAMEIIFLILGGVLAFVVGLIAAAVFMNPPLKAAKHSDGIFTLNGPSDEALRRLSEHQAPGRDGW
jgi:hypothetical protein